MGELKFKVHSLTGRITPELMRKAFKAVQRNRGAAGIDKVSIGRFQANLDQNLDALMRDIKTGAFRHLPLRRVFIPKPDGRQRPLGIPAVRDRVGQEVLRRLLNPIFEPLFHEDSYGFRRGRSAHQAVQRVQAYADQGYTFVLDADIKGFFDAIPHKLMMACLTERVADGKILDLVESCLKAGVVEDGQLKPTRKGTPQGGVVSPLLANIVLNRLDWALQSGGFKFVRYADDFVVLCRSMDRAKEAMDLVRHVVEGELGLELHPEKTRVVRYSDGFEFLGFSIARRRTQMRAKAVEAFKTKVRAITVRSRNLDAEVVVRLNRVIRGTLNYFGASFATGDNLFRDFDKWIRKRIRCMKYKRISRADHYRLLNKHIHRLGVLGCQSLYRMQHGH